MYSTVQGDRFDLIAYKIFGDRGMTDKIMNANRPCLGYYIFPAGVALNIPEAALAITGAAVPWRAVAG